MTTLLNRTSAITIFYTILLLSCQVSGERIRRRLVSPSQDEDADRFLTSSNSTTCSSINVNGFATCSVFCEEQTGSSLNTFIVMESQLCCACFSGDAYCSDDIPECTDYVNLDYNGVSNKWNNSEENDNDEDVFDAAAVISNSSTIVNSNSSISCLELNVTNTLACIDFCEEETGDTSHEFGFDDVGEEYYCVCSSTILGGGTATYCSDNMSDNWHNALANSTILPIGARLILLP